MKSLSVIESKKIVENLITKLKKGVTKKEIKIEYFDLTLHEPNYFKIDAAYVQTHDAKEALLYDAVMRDFYFIKEEKPKGEMSKPVPVLSKLDKSVRQLIPQSIIDKMFGVCGSKKDEQLFYEDFGVKFSLTKPKS